MAAVVVIWLLVSVFKKLFQLAILGTVVIVGFVLWRNPELLKLGANAIGTLMHTR